MNSRKLIGNAIILTAVGIVIARCKKDNTVYIDTLPESIKDYVNTYFPSHTIMKAVQSRNGLRKTYDVLMDGHLSLEFNKRGEVIEIEGNSKLPDLVIPDKILAFVSIYFPDNVVLEWELENKSQEVKLDNGLELNFNLDGEFLGVDY